MKGVDSSEPFLFAKEVLSSQALFFFSSPPSGLLVFCRSALCSLGDQNSQGWAAIIRRMLRGVGGWSGVVEGGEEWSKGCQVGQ